MTQKKEHKENLPEKKTASSRRRNQSPHMDPERYNKLVKGAVLLGVNLVESQFKILPIFLKSMNVGDDIDFHLNENDPIISYDSKSGKIIVMVTWGIVGGPISEPHSLDCSVTYLVAFEIGDGWEENEVAFFGRRVGASALYPYFRQHLHHLSAESGANIPLAPLRKAVPVRVKGGIRDEINLNKTDSKSTK